MTRLARALAICACMAAFGWAVPAPAAAMSFSLSPLALRDCQRDCPEVIVASGEIELDSDIEFLRFVTSEVLGRKVTSIVLMSSPGGNLVGSIKLGLMMRELGFSIMVGQLRGGAFATARCFSACAYTLAGGLKRIVPEGSEVGVHKAWTKRAIIRDLDGGSQLGPEQSTDRFSPYLARYLQRMGVSARLVALADQTPSSDIRILTRAELSKLRVMTPEARSRKRRG